MSDARQRMVDVKRLGQMLLVVLLLGVFALSALYSITKKSPTSDEGIHLTAGYSYWQDNDYRLQPENGNLPQRWAAIPLLFQPINQYGHNHYYWKTGNVWELEWVFLYLIKNDPFWMIFTARSMIVLAGVFIGLLLFCYARQLWGYGGGVLALTLYCFSPDVLAHTRLITSDVIGAGAFIAAVWALSLLLRRISWRTVHLCGLAFGVLAVSKYYAVLMVPITALLILLQLALSAQTTIALRQSHELTAWPKRLGAHLAALVGVGFIAWIILWSFYGFRYNAFNDDLHFNQFLESWEDIRPDSEFIAKSIDIAREYHLLPESYLYGFSHVVKHSEFRHAFMAGEYSSYGWWYFFLFTFLVKSPAALLAMLMLLLITFFVRKRDPERRREFPKWLPLVVLILVFGVAALMTTLNIGHRHILPIYLSLFILLGGLWKLCKAHGQATIGLLIALVGFYIAESVSVYPHYLTFFNRLAGGPENGYLLLVDSSLDWGQDLYLVDEWLLKNNTGPNREEATLSYFGRSSPDYLKMDVRYWQSRGLFQRQSYTIQPLKPGLFIISATLLEGMYSPTYYPWTQQFESNYVYLLDEVEKLTTAATDLESAIAFINQEPDGARKWFNKLSHFEDYRAWRLRIYLLEREPDVVLGNTMFIYRLTDEDIREMLIRPEVGFADDFPMTEFRQQFINGSPAVHEPNEGQ